MSQTISKFKKAITYGLTLFIFLILQVQGISQQEPDTSFTFSISQPEYARDSGPLIYIDEAHHNFHTLASRFYPFAKLMRLDGYRVESLSEAITSTEVLKDCKILVIANALNASDTVEWVLPTLSAFSTEEISILKKWVENGGRLLLIADHMPFAGAVSDLAKAFGFEFLNGFAYTGGMIRIPTMFSLKKGMLANSPVAKGSSEIEKIDSVGTFLGSAFKAPKKAIPVLRFLPDHYSLQPDTAFRYDEHTPEKKLKGYLQGALLNFDKGKIAVFGEAAMFTAQIVNGRLKMGFNSEDAPQNAQFTLNLIHWLDKP